MLTNESAVLQTLQDSRISLCWLWLNHEEKWPSWQGDLNIDEVKHDIQAGVLTKKDKDSGELSQGKDSESN